MVLYCSPHPICGQLYNIFGSLVTRIRHSTSRMITVQIYQSIFIIILDLFLTSHVMKGAFFFLQYLFTDWLLHQFRSDNTKHLNSMHDLFRSSQRRIRLAVCHLRLSLPYISYFRFLYSSYWICTLGIVILFVLALIRNMHNCAFVYIKDTPTECQNQWEADVGW